MRWFLRFLAVVLVLGIAAAAGVLWWGWESLHEPYRQHDGEVRIEIRSGRSATGILEELAEKGVLANALTARVYLVHKLKDPPLQAGEYVFEEPLNTPQVLDKLIRGEVVTYPVTVIEGFTLEETAQVLAEAGFGDEETFRQEMQRADLVSDFDTEAEDLEGYLYPDTYRFARGATEGEIVAAMVENFKRRFQTEVEPLMAEYGGTVRELVTLASIVEKEAQKVDERAVIASVYSNRLRIGMALQADPTTIYAFKRLGTWNGNLRRPDLKLDSPYNTYVYPGLPPGPICSPRVANMVASAKPADTPYFYFVSRNDGTHVFARTYEEHQRNVNEWQKRYWRRKWAEERRSK